MSRPPPARCPPPPAAATADPAETVTAAGSADAWYRRRCRWRAAAPSSSTISSSTPSRTSNAGGNANWPAWNSPSRTCRGWSTRARTRSSWTRTCWTTGACRWPVSFRPTATTAARCRRGSSSTAGRWRSVRTTATTSPNSCATSSWTRSRCSSAATPRRSTRPAELPSGPGYDRAAELRGHPSRIGQPVPGEGDVESVAAVGAGDPRDQLLEGHGMPEQAHVGLLPAGGALQHHVGDPRPVLLPRRRRPQGEQVPVPWPGLHAAPLQDHHPAQLLVEDGVGRAEVAVADLRDGQLPRRGPHGAELGHPDTTAHQPARLAHGGARPIDGTDRRREPRLARRRGQRCDADGRPDRLIRPRRTAGGARVHPAGEQPAAVVGGRDDLRYADPPLLGPPPAAQLGPDPEPAALGHGQVDDPVGQDALHHAQPGTQIGDTGQGLLHTELGEQRGHAGMRTAARCGTPRIAHRGIVAARPGRRTGTGGCANRCPAMLGPMDIPAAGAGPWIVLGVVLGIGLVALA